MSKTKNTIYELIQKLVENYCLKNQVKEITINIYENGALSLSGREKLISEFNHSDYAKEYIAVVFAASSDSLFSGELVENLDSANKLKCAISELGVIDASKYFSGFTDFQLKNIAPLLERVAFKYGNAN